MVTGSEKLHFHRTLAGPVKDKRVKELALGRIADVFKRERRLDRLVRHLGVALAVHVPGTRTIDAFAIDVLAPRKPPRVRARTALFDPKGETAQLLSGLGVRFDTVAADADLSPYDVLVIGKRALTVDGRAPDLGRVRDGLRAVVFEQEAAVLETLAGAFQR